MKQLLLSFIMSFAVICFADAQKITLQTQVKCKDKNVITSLLSVKSKNISFGTSVNLASKPSLKTVFLQIAPYGNLNICIGNFTFGGLFPQLKKTAFSVSSAFASVTAVLPDVRAYTPGISTSGSTPYSFLISDSFDFNAFVLNVYAGGVTKISNSNKILEELKIVRKGQDSYFSGFGIKFTKIDLVIAEIIGSHFVIPKLNNNWYRTTRIFVPQRIVYSAFGMGYKNDFIHFSHLSEISSSPFGEPTFSSRNELKYTYNFFSLSSGLYVSSLDHLIPNSNMSRKVFSAYINPYGEIYLPFDINVKAGLRYTAGTSWSFSRKAEKTDSADLVFDGKLERKSFSLSGKLALNEASFNSGNFLRITEESSFLKEIGVSVENKYGKFSQIYGCSFETTIFPKDAAKDKELQIGANWTAKMDKWITLYAAGTFDYIKKIKYECEGFSLKQKVVLNLLNGKTTFSLQTSGSTKFNKKSDSILDFLLNAKIAL